MLQKMLQTLHVAVTQMVEMSQILTEMKSKQGQKQRKTTGGSIASFRYTHTPTHRLLVESQSMFTSFGHAEITGQASTMPPTERTPKRNSSIGGLQFNIHALILGLERRGRLCQMVPGEVHVRNFAGQQTLSTMVRLSCFQSPMIHNDLNCAQAYLGLHYQRKFIMWEVVTSAQIWMS